MVNKSQTIDCLRTVFLRVRYVTQTNILGPVYMEWGTPVQWDWFLFSSRSGAHKTKESYPTRPGSPTPCKQGLSGYQATALTLGLKKKKNVLSFTFSFFVKKTHVNNSYIAKIHKQSNINCEKYVCKYWDLESVILIEETGILLMIGIR